MAGALMLSILLISRRKGYGGYRRPATPIEIARSFRSDSILGDVHAHHHSWGGIRFGVFTPDRGGGDRSGLRHGGHDSHLPENVSARGGGRSLLGGGSGHGHGDVHHRRRLPLRLDARLRAGSALVTTSWQRWGDQQPAMILLLLNIFLLLIWLPDGREWRRWSS